MGDTVSAEDLARQLHERIRNRVLRRILRSDQRISRLYAELGARLRRRLRLIGMTDAEVAAVVEEEFRAVEDALLPEVQADLEDAAEQGNDAARRTLARIAGTGAEGAVPFSRARDSSLARARASSQRRASEGRSPETA